MSLADLKAALSQASNLSQLKGLSAAYNTLLGGIPSIDGYAYLIKTNNDTNFGSGPGPIFNDENIIINTLNALYQGNSAAKLAFDLIIGGGLAGTDALTAVYNYVIPPSFRSDLGLAYFKSQEAFYTARAAELGIPGATGPAVVAFAALTKIAVDNKIGGLGDQLNDLIGAINNGTAAIPQNAATLTDLETADGTDFDADDTPTSTTPPIYSIAVNPSSVLEGDAGPGTTITFTVSRTGDISKAGTVSLTLVGTASIGGDFDLTPPESIVSFAAGASSATFTTTVKPDTQFEPDETITFLLTNITGGGTLSILRSVTATIINDDVAPTSGVYTIVASPASVVEGNGGLGNTITYTVLRAGDVSKAGSVAVALSGTADGSDYITSLSGGVISFAPDENQLNFTVTTTPDTTVEPNETVIATLGTITGGGMLGANTSATATITNDDTGTGVPVYDIAVTPSSVVEGNSGQGNAITYTISRIGDLSLTGTIGVSLTGSATFGADYTSTVSGGVVVFVPGEGPALSPNGGPVFFAEGQSQASFTVTTTPDTTFEPNETVIASLASISGTGTFGTANSATATITNDDTAASGPVYAIAVTPSSVVELSGGIGNPITYTVTRTGDVSQAGSVAVSLSGTADGSDYTTSLSGGVISFAPNENQLSFTVTAIPDRRVEPNETVIATLGTITGGGTIETLGSATATITNDDTIEYSIAVSASSVTEGNTGPGATITYTASRTGDLSTTDVISLFYQGTANGLDYETSERAFVGWEAGASTTTWTVTVLPDTQVEPNETITVLINGGNFGGVGPANSVTTTIVNDDADPTGTVYTIEASASSAAEGNGGTGNTITYTVVRKGDFTSPGSVAVTFGGSATLGLDYTSALSGGVVSFAYGEDRKSFTITTIPDLGFELNETVRAALGAITLGGGNIGATSSATATITNDDTDLLNTFYSIAVSPSSVTEGNSGPGGVIAYTITRTGDTSEAGAVNVILQGTASAQIDYSLPFFGSVVRFAAGQTEFIYNLTVRPDTTSESDETVTVSLDSFPHGAQLGNPSSATAVILNDDAPLPSPVLIGIHDMVLPGEPSGL